MDRFAETKNQFMKKHYIFSTVILSAIWIAGSVQLSNSSSGAGPFKNTGSPGDGAVNTCAKCHMGTLNSGPGNLSLDVSDVPGTGYRTGQTYSIGVDLNDDRMTNGFQVTIEDASGNKHGTFMSSSGVKIVGPTSDWATHDKPSSTGQWTVNWQAPSMAVDSLIIYAVGNAANGNGATTGDRIYTTNTTIYIDPNVGISEERNSQGWTLLENPVHNVIRISSETETQLEVYSISGNRITGIKIQRGLNEFPVTSLRRGMYIMRDVRTSEATRIIVN